MQETPANIELTSCCDTLEVSKESRGRRQPATLPAPDCDTLCGFEQIGLWQGITGGQARSRANAGLIPVHRPKGRNVVLAFKSEILAHQRALTSSRSSRKVAEESKSE